MNGELTILIQKFKQFKPFGNATLPAKLNFILNFEQFVKVLERINNRVGLDNVKREIAIKVNSMIINYQKHGTPIYKEKLHTCISGSPGTGKTTLGSDLAELWAVSGCLKSRSSAEPGVNNESTKLQDVITQNKLYATQSITLINKLRRKVNKYPKDFQAIKSLLRNISSDMVIVRPPVPMGILPVIIPNVPLNPIEFGTISIPEPKPEIKCKFGVLTRADFLGKYQGHTTDRVRKIFAEYEGGVIMIDEVYDLVTSDSDDFGREILTEIINHMTRFPDKIVFIFSGYLEQMNRTIFSIQPGLSRRFKWKFHISGYKPEQLAQISTKQLSEIGIQVSEDLNLTEFFQTNKDYFKHFGGDTEKLADFIRDTLHTIMGKSIFENDKIIDEIVTLNVLNLAFERYSENYSKPDPIPDFYT